jgi:hypothetical protein
MNRMLLTGLLAGAAAILSPVSAVAQEAEPAFLEVGEPAPDFELVGATRGSATSGERRSSWPSSSEPGRLAERFK